MGLPPVVAERLGAGGAQAGEYRLQGRGGPGRWVPRAGPARVQTGGPGPWVARAGPARVQTGGPGRGRLGCGAALANLDLLLTKSVKALITSRSGASGRVRAAAGHSA